MTISDDIIKDLLKKIDSLQETINTQNTFIMRMATYRDEREDRSESDKAKRWGEFHALIRDTDAVGALSRWLLERERAHQRPPYSAGQPDSKESSPEGQEDLDS